MPSLHPSPSQHEIALACRAFAGSLHEEHLVELLAYLNGLSTHRFTGIYRFEPGWVVSVALYDRQNPNLRVGANVKMKESYCWLTGLNGTGYIIEDATRDARLGGHAARDEVRSYIAVLLTDKCGVPWGTLCHFDFEPRVAHEETLAQLNLFRPLVEEVLVRDAHACWAPDAPPC